MVQISDSCIISFRQKTNQIFFDAAEVISNFGLNIAKHYTSFDKISMNSQWFQAESRDLYLKTVGSNK